MSLKTIARAAALCRSLNGSQGEQAIASRKSVSVLRLAAAAEHASGQAQHGGAVPTHQCLESLLVAFPCPHGQQVVVVGTALCVLQRCDPVPRHVSAPLDLRYTYRIADRAEDYRGVRNEMGATASKQLTARTGRSVCTHPFDSRGVCDDDAATVQGEDDRT